MKSNIFHEFFDVTSSMPVLILKFLKSIVKSDHPIFHFADRPFNHILELIDFFNLVILPLDHKFNFRLCTFLKLAKLIDSLNNFFINPFL